MNREIKIFLTFLAIFLIAYFIPLATPRFDADASPAGAKVVTRSGRGARHAAVVRPQSYAGLRGPGAVHRRSDHDLLVQGVGAQTPRPQGEQGRVLLRRLGLRHRVGGLFLQRAADVCRHLSGRCWTGAGRLLSVCRTGHQCTGDLPDRPRARFRTRCGASASVRWCSA